MANAKNDISDIVKKCKILLLDIEGTTTSISFVKDKLFPYAEENVKDFLTSDWESDDVKEAVTALRKLALEDEEKKVEGVVTIPGEDASKDDQIEGLVKSVKWQMSLDRKVGALKQLQGLIWKKGYDKGDIKGHVYDDVSPALELWRSAEGQKVYIYSSGSVQAQKLLFSLSSAGDLLKFIDGHFDTAVGAKQEAASYKAIAEKIECKPEEILFLTDIDKEAEAARSAGVQAALVSREGNAPLPPAAAAAFPVLYSLAELAATNKRKPDAQDEQPAKVLKTDVETDVKTASDTEEKDKAQTDASTVPEESDELEKMEVEEEAPAKAEAPAEKPTEVVEKVETIVEEITDPKAITDMPVCDVEPVIEETPEKTDAKGTEHMETEPVETANIVSEPKETADLKNGDKNGPVPEETPPAVITEIKDITNDKESLTEVAEIIEDLVPVVEEPPAQDMEELQNVGEVLEKECDEILSKVQDVTNLDNIPVKPLLNPIAEETMETENLDSNDIVERILDSELELEMKQCTDIDLNTVQEISDAKPAPEEEKIEKSEDASDETATIVPEEKPSEKVAEEVKVTEEKVAETIPIEEKVQASPTEQKIEESTPTEVKPEDSKVVTDDEKTKTEEKVKDKIETVHNKIETAVNDKKETEVTNKMESEVNNKMETETSNNMETEVSNKLATEVSDKSETEVSNKTETEVGNKTENEVSNIMETEVSNKTETQESNKMETEVINKMETEDSNKMETKVSNKIETEVSPPETVDNKPKTEEKTEEKAEEKKVEPEKSETESKETVESKETPAETSSMETEQTKTPVDTETKEPETKESDKMASESVSEEPKPESDAKETQVNGKTTNGDAETVLNGDASKEDELSSRLSMENGKDEVNGANGDSTDAEKAKSENNGDEVKDVADIKVKTVAVDEPRNDPIEQPTEA